MITKVVIAPAIHVGSGTSNGDMTKAVYDTNNDGAVNDSDRLADQLPAYYLDRANHTGSQNAGTITQDSTHRFATDTEKAAWNAKQAGLGFTPEDSANKAITLAAPDNTKYPTTQAVTEAIAAAIANLIDSAPGTLDTLNEIAAALGDDPNFAATITQALAGKVDKVAGKGLSTNDYTTAEKSKLSGLNNYDDAALQAAVSSLQEDPTTKTYVDNGLSLKANIADVHPVQVFEQEEEPAGGTYHAGDIWIQPEA